MTTRSGIALSLLTVVGLAAGACKGSGPDVAVATGTWAGSSAAMTVTTAGAHIEFSCAVGDIPQPLMTDNGGEFSTTGTYALQVGPSNGPQQPARYTGRVDNQRMTLTVLLTGTNQTVGSFTLSFGAPATIPKCL